MERKIEKQDLVDIQQEITDVYYNMAELKNKKNGIDTGVEVSGKTSLLALIVSIFATAAFSLNWLSAIVWLITVVACGTFSGFGIAKINNYKQLDELKQKTKDLEQLQKNMQVDYQLAKKKEEQIQVSKKEIVNKLYKTETKVEEKTDVATNNV